MPKPVWLFAALAAVAVLFITADPLGLFEADQDGADSRTNEFEDLLGDAPELAGRAVEGELELTEFEGDPVGTFDFRLGAGVLLGRVTGEEQPLELARVRPVLPPPFDRMAVRTRPDGTYELRGLPLEQLDLRVSKDGWISRTEVAPLIVEPDAAVAQDGAVAKDGAAADVVAEVKTIDLVRRVDSHNAIVIHATDTFGHPLPGAKVLATTLAWDLHLAMGPETVGVTDVRHKSGTTDKDGQCRLADMQPDRYNVVVSAPGHRTAAINRIRVSAGQERTVRLQLAPATTIAGIVQDVDGNGVGGAFVMGIEMGTFQSSIPVRAGADGRFVLDGLRKGTYMLVAGHEDGGDGQSQAKAPTASAKIKLGGTGLLRVKVVHEDGTPVTKAKVRPFQPEPYNFGRIYSMLLDLDDPEGTLETRLSGGSYMVRVKTPDGSTSQDIAVKVEVGETVEIEVRVPQTGSVRGVVVDESGNHVAGAEVYVQVGGFPKFKSRERYARTDDEGAFEVTGLFLEPVILHVSHVAHADTEFNATPDLASQTRELTITMPQGAVVTGRLRDAEGRPIAGEQFTIFQGMDFMGAEITFTDGGGVFRFDGVPQGKYTIKQGLFENGAPGMSKSVNVGTGGTVTVDFDLAAAGGSVTGTVRVGGKPIAGAIVTVTDGRGFSNAISATTDEGGNFVASGVQPGSYQVWVQSQDGISTNVSGSFEEAATTDTITIDLGTSGIVGRVIDSKGEPIANAWLTVEDADAGLDDDWSRVKAQATTDGDGRFSTTGLSGGRYEVRISSGQHAQVLTKPVSVPEGSTQNLGEITLADAVLLSGRITDDAGTPVENVTIGLADASGRAVFLFSMSTTGSDGRYKAQGLTPGRYTVKFEAPGYSPFESPVEIGPSGATKDGVLTRGGAVEIKVTNEGGYPVGGARVVLIDGRGRIVSKTLSFANLEGSRSYTGEDGMVRVSDLAAGTYQVRVESEGLVQDDEPTIVIAPGQTGIQEVSLRKP